MDCTICHNILLPKVVIPLLLVDPVGFNLCASNCDFEPNRFPAASMGLILLFKGDIYFFT